jgi:hypothetical protein
VALPHNCTGSNCRALCADCGDPCHEHYPGEAVGLKGSETKCWAGLFGCPCHGFKEARPLEKFKRVASFTARSL